MEWYCTECGRPSDTNGGTCECGSTSFERAVVQVTKECTTCGTRVPEHTTTCPDCGFPATREATSSGGVRSVATNIPATPRRVTGVATRC